MHIVFDGQLVLLENSLSRYTRNLVRELARLGQLKLSLLVFSRTAPSELKAKHSWIPPGVELIVLDGAESPYGLSRLQFFWRQLRIALKLWRVRPDVYQAHYANFPIPLGYRVVTTLHDVFQYVPSLHRSSRFARFRKLMDKWSYRMAHLVCVSENTRRDFLRFLDPHHKAVDVCLSGADPAFSAQESALDLQTLKQWNLDETPYLLYVGDLTPRKDIPTLIRAFHKAKPKLGECQLALTKGIWVPGPETRLVEELGLEECVTFLGHIAEADLPALYRGARAFAFPSLYEGFGFPPLEAMACGVPVICSSSSSLPEVVGDAALLFEPGHVDELASHLIEIWTNDSLRHQLREAGPRRAKLFSWRNVALRMSEIYHSLPAKA